MIDILECDLEGKAAEVSTFKIKGTCNNELFYCSVEFNIVTPDLDELTYERLNGANLSPDDLDALEELLDEIIDTETYQDALEEAEEN